MNVLQRDSIQKLEWSKSPSSPLFIKSISYFLCEILMVASIPSSQQSCLLLQQQKFKALLYHFAVKNSWEI